MKNFSPNVLIMVIVLVLLGASAVIFLNRQNNSGLVSDSSLPQTSDSPTLTASSEYPAADSPDVRYIESYNTQVSGSPLPSPEPLSQYIYPGTDVLTQTVVKVEMQSSQDSTKITEWYKQKVRELGFNAKSFTQTTTNGVVLNKLSAAKPGDKIEVTIKKDQTESIVTITVDRL